MEQRGSLQQQVEAARRLNAALLEAIRRRQEQIESLLEKLTDGRRIFPPTGSAVPG